MKFPGIWAFSPHEKGLTTETQGRNIGFELMAYRSEVPSCKNFIWGVFDLRTSGSWFGSHKSSVPGSKSILLTLGCYWIFNFLTVRPVLMGAGFKWVYWAELLKSHKGSVRCFLHFTLHSVKMLLLLSDGCDVFIFSGAFSIELFCISSEQMCMKHFSHHHYDCRGKEVKMSPCKVQ